MCVHFKIPFSEVKWIMGFRNTHAIILNQGHEHIILLLWIKFLVFSFHKRFDFIIAMPLFMFFYFFSLFFRVSFLDLVWHEIYRKTYSHHIEFNEILL